MRFRIASPARIRAVIALAALALAAVPLALGRAAAQALPTIPDAVPVALDAGTTALLVLDLNSAICPPRPACMASLGPVAALLANARAANVFVVHSTTLAPGVTTLREVAPLPGEPTVASVADKFFNTPLDEILSSHGITTALIVGSASNGAVLYTSFEANARGYTVAVAEDGISAGDDFATFLTRYQLLNQPGFTNPDNTPLRERAVTLTRTNLVSFR